MYQRLRNRWRLFRLLRAKGMPYSRMAYGIQRRTIYIVPPNRDDLRWIFEQFHRQEILEMFGYAEMGPHRMPEVYESGCLVMAIIRRVVSRKRIGFVVMYPPAGFNFWEFGYAIPDAAERNAFDALNATDAMAHYMFEHLRVPKLGWRTREDNVAADAVVRRLGYKMAHNFEELGHHYRIYELDQEGWARRRARLDRGEKAHPAGIGGTFAVLRAPYEPILASTRADSGEEEAQGES